MGLGPGRGTGRGGDLVPPGRGGGGSVGPTDLPAPRYDVTLFMSILA